MTTHAGASPAKLEHIKARLIAQADRQNAQYPQYRGHWSGPEWGLVLITSQVKTKAGIAFDKFEIVLARDGGIIESGPYAGQRSATCYSAKNKVDTAVRATHIQWLTGPNAAV